MLAAVVFIRRSRYGNMACLTSAAGSEAADAPTASLRVRLPQLPHVERNCLQKSNCDISLTSTFWLPSLLTSVSEGIERLLRPHQKKKKKKKKYSFSCFYAVELIAWLSLKIDLKF